MSGEAVALVSFLLAACSPQRQAGSPTPMPHPRRDWRAVTSFLDSAVARGAAPGAVLGVTYRGERFVYVTGQLGADDPRPVTAATISSLSQICRRWLG